MKKQNKIIVAVSPDGEIRRKLLQKLCVTHGFALTPGEAGKLIKSSPYDFDLSRAYFVVADLYNFRQSPLMNQHLYEMAARGMAVIIGTKKLQPEFEFICETYYVVDL